MNTDAFVILVIPLMGLFVIFRNGKFNPRLVPSSVFLSGICWIGWFSSLMAGLWVLFRP